MTIDIRVGDALTVLRTLPDESIHCCVTSPPYLWLRDYGLPPVVWGGDESCGHQWGEDVIDRSKATPGTKGSGLTSTGTSAMEGNRFESRSNFCVHCGAWRGQLGLEPTPDLYVAHLVTVLREVRRVLRKDGTLWLNIGDSYAGSGKGIMSDGSFTGGPKQQTNRGSILPAGKHAPHQRDGAIGRAWVKPPPGIKRKELIGVPWMVAFALRADGWYVRSEIIWAKRSVMPESVTDRPTKAHETVFLLSKSPRYFYDADAIKEPVTKATLADRPNDGERIDRDYPGACDNGNGRLGEGEYRNKRSVWLLSPQPFKEAHYATMPPKLALPCILAGGPRGGGVLDPFSGAGTTGLVCSRLGRDFIGIELGPKYAAMSRKRIRDDAPLFHDPEAA